MGGKAFRSSRFPRPFDRDGYESDRVLYRCPAFPPNTLFSWYVNGVLPVGMVSGTGTQQRQHAKKGQTHGNDVGVAMRHVRTRRRRLAS